MIKPTELLEKLKVLFNMSEEEENLIFKAPAMKEVRDDISTVIIHVEGGLATVEGITGSVQVIIIDMDNAEIVEDDPDSVVQVYHHSEND